MVVGSCDRTDRSAITEEMCSIKEEWVGYELISRLALAQRQQPSQDGYAQENAQAET